MAAQMYLTTSSLSSSIFLPDPKLPLTFDPNTFTRMTSVITELKTLALAVLLNLPASNAAPQNVFPSCYDSSEFKTENTKDVSQWRWWGSSADICQAREYSQRHCCVE